MKVWDEGGGVDQVFLNGGSMPVKPQPWQHTRWVMSRGRLFPLPPVSPKDLKSQMCLSRYYCLERLPLPGADVSAWWRWRKRLGMR